MVVVGALHECSAVLEVLVLLALVLRTQARKFFFLSAARGGGGAVIVAVFRKPELVGVGAEQQLVVVDAFLTRRLFEQDLSQLAVTKGLRWCIVSAVATSLLTATLARLAMELIHGRLLEMTRDTVGRP